MPTNGMYAEREVRLLMGWALLKKRESPSLADADIIHLMLVHYREQLKAAATPARSTNQEQPE